MPSLDQKVLMMLLVAALFGIANAAFQINPNGITVWSPLDGSYWLAGSTHRIRLSAKGVIPSQYTIDILNVNGSLNMSIFPQPTYPMAGDEIVMSQILNYTIWTIDPSLANGRYKMKVTGIVPGAGSQTVTQTTGVFFIGPNF